MKRVGVEITELNYSKNKCIKLLNDIRLITKKNDIEYILFSCLDDSYLKNNIDELYRIDLPKVLICFDNLSVPFRHKKTCNLYDLVWLTSHETNYLFKRWGANTLFQPYASNPYFFKPTSNIDNLNVCFIGSIYGFRLTALNKLHESNIPLDIYSTKIVHSNPISNAKKNLYKSINDAVQLSKFPIGRKLLFGALYKSFKRNEYSKIENKKNYKNVNFDQIPYIYNSSGLCLNITELWNTYLLKIPLHKLHLRTFEIPSSGGIEFVSINNELCNYYENQKEIIMYEDMNDACELAKYFLDPKRHSTRLKLKEKARSKTISEHTWLCRFNKILSSLGKKNIRA